VPATFLISKSSDQEYSFVLRAENNETILTSQKYRTKAGAQGGIQSVRDYCADESRYEHRLAPDGGHFFILKTARGEPIAQSKNYPYLDALDRAIATIKRVARRAVVV
jgi:uncharacterized protein YegP (UPF0339 family)